MIEKTQTLIVSEELTAQKVGSGLLPVYATPAVVALMENTACQCITEIDEAETTVGILMNIQHVKASAIGEKVICTATLESIEGKKYSFSIKVVNNKGEEIAIAVHERIRVNKERFMQKVLANSL